MAVKLALAGDTMPRRGVGERLAADPGHAPLDAELEGTAREADLFIVNLQSAGISAVGPQPDDDAARTPGVPAWLRECSAPGPDVGSSVRRKRARLVFETGGLA